MTNMLVVTTTVRMFDGVHSNTTNLGPAVALGFVLVVGATSLEHRLVNATTTSNNTDGASAGRLNGLLGTRGKTDAGSTGLSVVRDNGSVVTRGTGNSSSVSWLLFQVADEGTFGHRTDGEDVTDLEVGLLSAVDELSSVETLYSDESLLDLLVLVRVTEDNLGERGTSSRVVDDILYDTLDVSVVLGGIERSKLGSSLSVLGVSLED
jgi:hypothetical protein